MDAYQAGNIQVAERAWDMVQAIWSRAWAANCAVMDFMEGAGLTRLSPVKQQRRVVAYVSSGDGGEVRNVRLVIEDEDRHQIVSRAYETREPVMVSGDLQPTQGQLTMNPATAVRPVKSEDTSTAGDG
jgi:hypothetical protein